MVDEVVEEFHSNAELYNLEVELIRNKQLERTKQKLALRREKRRQSLVIEKKKRERAYRRHCDCSLQLFRSRHKIDKIWSIWKSVATIRRQKKHAPKAMV